MLPIELHHLGTTFEFISSVNFDLTMQLHSLQATLILLVPKPTCVQTANMSALGHRAKACWEKTLFPGALHSRQHSNSVPGGGAKLPRWGGDEPYMPLLPGVSAGADPVRRAPTLKPSAEPSV